MAHRCAETINCSILSHIGFVILCEKNVEILKEKWSFLASMREGVEHLVQMGRRNGYLTKPLVQWWLDEVISVQDEAKKLIDKAEEITKSHWRYLARHHLGKEALEMIHVVDQLLSEGQSFSDSSTSVSDPAPSYISLHNSGFQTFSSRDSVAKEIMTALTDENIHTVGVYGMAGMGKTYLIKNLVEQVRRDGLFDVILMHKVSQNPNLKNIQCHFAWLLGMTEVDEEQCSCLRAEWLSERLKKEKRVLVILDDLWQRLDLAMVGIPLGDNHVDCKVVITTRSQDACNGMETQKNIKVEGLSEQDSLILFQQNLFEVVDSTSSKRLFREAVNECGGLPLAIVTVGRNMRTKIYLQQDLWKIIVSDLKKSTYFNSELPVFSSVKSSYDYLESEDIKWCLLYCCFFPKNHNVKEEELMRYVMGEKLFRNVSTIDEGRSRLHAILDKLISSCLLLKGDRDGHVRMHGVVYDIVLSIASEENNGFITKAGLGLTIWDTIYLKPACKRTSLMGNKISRLVSDQSKCPQLLSLSLSRNSTLKKIPKSFFERMTSLVTLDLQDTGISSLPSSFSCLVKLRTLDLGNNPLLDVSLVGKLKQLEILSLRRTLIQRLPEEIRELSNLKLLDLSHTTHLETIPRYQLSRLFYLEELYMEDSFKGWETEGMEDESNARLAELLSLNYLHILHLRVEDVKCFPKEMMRFTFRLKRFQVQINDGPPTIVETIKQSQD